MKKIKIKEVILSNFGLNEVKVFSDFSNKEKSEYCAYITTSFKQNAYFTIRKFKKGLKQIFVWLLISNVVGIFIFYLWAKIASLAMFIPNGDIISKIIEGYKGLFNN